MRGLRDGVCLQPLLQECGILPLENTAARELEQAAQLFLSVFP